MAQIKSVVVERAVALGLIDPNDVERCRTDLGDGADDSRVLAWLVKHSLLTKWQATQLETGRTQNLALGHYRLLAPLGAGGMGSVYRALDTKLNRQVALKVLPPRQATPEAISRFKREAFVALQMRHDNVVTSFELAQHGTVHFLVMELVDGLSLSAHLARQRRLSVRETARIGYEVALALAHAHGQGIIHRDIKPSNILLSREGNVKVADMGLAKFFGPQAQSGGHETRTGQFMGTIDYCSPEQAIDAKRADIRSDIYSLGCTLYHCLAGEPPFVEGTEVQRIMAHIEMLPVAIRSKNRDVPSAFAELIERRMLAKDPGNRFQTPLEAAEALAAWVKGEGAAANPWAGLEFFDGLLEVAAEAPRIDVPRAAAPQSGRDTVRRRPARLTSRPRKIALGAKSESVLRRPLTLAAVVLVILGAALLAIRWWPRQQTDETINVANASPGLDGQSESQAADDQDTLGSRDQNPVNPPDGDGSDRANSSVTKTISPPVVIPPPADGSPASPPAPRPLDDPTGGTPAEKAPIESAATNQPGLLLSVKHGAPVTAVAVSADGATLITGGSDKTARLWNAAGGAARGSPLTLEDGRPITIVSIGADGRYVITGTHLPFQTLDVGVRPLGWSRAHRGFVEFQYHLKDTPFSLWDMSPGGGNGKKLLLTAGEAMAIGSDGKEVLALDSDVSTGVAALRRYQPASGTYRDTPLQPPDWDGRLHSARFSPDLRFLVAGGYRNSAPDKGKKILRRRGIWFWDTETGRLAGKPKRFAEGTTLDDLIYAFRPDSRELAVIITKITQTTAPAGMAEWPRSNPMLQILGVPSAQVLKEFELPETDLMLRNIVFHPFGDLMACTGNSGTLVLRDAETGQARGPCLPIKGAASAAFSSDCNRLFLGMYDGTAELWELDALLNRQRGALPPDDRRIKWMYKKQWDGTNSGSFEHRDDGTWTETKDGAGGKIVFAEWKRNADYVLLFDRGRRMFLRCYNDRVEIFNAQKGTWGLLYTGEWMEQ